MVRPRSLQTPPQIGPRRRLLRDRPANAIESPLAGVRLVRSNVQPDRPPLPGRSKNGGAVSRQGPRRTVSIEADIAYRGFTTAGELRHASFKGLRDDE
jgi:hypothetical protein